MATSNNNIKCPAHRCKLRYYEIHKSVVFINSEMILSSNVPLGVLGYKIVYTTKRRLDFS